jgi:hypothetical protein
MQAKSAVLAAMTAGAWCAVAHAAPCYDIGAGEPKSLSGTIEYHVFPGPPNFADVQKGDRPEPTYVLRLDQPTCIFGVEAGDPNMPIPRELITRVQLAASTEAITPLLRANINRRVTVSLEDPSPPSTAHMREPLFAEVTSVVPAGRVMDTTDEFGTPATTIRAFYETLGDGQGEAASEMVVPEKRSGPFAAANLTRFYGHLREPIQLIEIEQSSPSVFVAHYRFATSSLVCDGRAIVTTVVRGGRNYIASIRALNGC